MNSLRSLTALVAYSQAVRTGTYEEVLGKGQTPPWALPTDVMKYQDEKRIETETGFVLDYKVSQL